jgi:hypothetical protein
MIKVDKLDMVKFVRDVYALSSPQGLGFFHFKDGDLSEQEAKEMVDNYSEDKRIAISLDYINGRSCKMTIFRSETGYDLPDSWYDHSESQYNELLKRHGIKREMPTNEKYASEPTLGVPSGCTLDPMLLMAVAMGKREHPCDRCNMDRNVCKGYARKNGVK